jgi:hypothetical protein
VTIDTLPDVALLETFEIYLDETWIEEWYTLVHVCRKWRYIVFGSPRRLDLRLCCKASTPVRETLDAWPPLPIVVWGDGAEEWGVDNINAALEHNNRICELILFDMSSSELEKVLVTMLQPFPALTRLRLQLQHRVEKVPVVPAAFLGGSAPRLQKLFLDCIPFLGLPNLLLSATHLVELDLRRIPHSGYISPEAMATSLSALSRLESLHIEFESPRRRNDPKSRRPPPPTRTLLPVLTNLYFLGANEYLEDLVAGIDAPRLDKLTITYSHELTFDTQQVTHFVSRTPKLKAYDEAHGILFKLGHFGHLSTGN